MAAGTINAVVGSGTLVTFPVLIALGVAPVVASMSNAMGLVFGTAAGGIRGLVLEISEPQGGTVKIYTIQ